MVEPVSFKNVAAAARIATAPTPVSAAAGTRALSGADEARVAVTDVARSLAAAPPVDVERVARIKKAIADGTFPILPAQIADRLIALKNDWNPHDPA